MLNLIFLLLFSPPSMTQPPQDRALQALCPYSPERFLQEASPSFSQTANKASIASALNDLASRFGPCLKAEKQSPHEAALWFKEVKMPLRLERDSSGRIIALAFGRLEYPHDSFAKIFHSIESPNHSLYVAREEKKLFGANEKKKLSVGESIYLLLLKRFRGKIAEKKLKPQSVVTLEPGDQANALGLLSEWPAPAYFTLDSLVHLMFYTGDEIAADLLLKGMGKDGLEPYAGKLKEFPSYRNLHLLLQLPEKEALARLKSGKLGNLPEAKVFEPLSGTTAATRQAGWFASTEELCNTLQELRNEANLKKNPTQMNDDRWDRVVYVRGTFPGLVNYTQGARLKRNHTWYCVSLTLRRDEKTDEIDALDALDRAFSLLEKN